MILRYRYDMTGATLAGYDQHPQIVIRNIAPDAVNFESVSIADCWLFDAEEIKDPPEFIEPAARAPAVSSS